jgi:hypothetical protein
MAINFPISPSLNQIYSYNGLSWQWNGSYWMSFPPSSGATGVVRTLTASTGLSANTTTGDITILFTGSTGSVFTGGTVSGATSFTGGLSANTISATTYSNLPLSVSGGGTTNYIPKWTGSTGIGNSIIYDTGTNIGIGLTNPGYKLEVRGGITASGPGNLGTFLAIDTSVGGATVALNAQLSTGIAQLVTYSNSPIVIATNSTERIRITNDGNFGIGIPSPSQRLHVSGNTLISGGLTATTISASTYSNVPIVTGGTYTSGTITFNNTTGGTFQVTGLPIGGQGGQLYYFNTSVTQTPYKEFGPTGTTASEQTTTISVASGVTSTIESYLTPSGYPNSLILPGGVWSFYLHSYKQDSSSSFDLYCDVYKRTSGGVETYLFSTDPFDVTTTASTPSMGITDAYFSGTPLTVSDRILVLVRATNTGVSTKQITFVTEGLSHYSYGITTFNGIPPNVSSLSTSDGISGNSTTGAVSIVNTDKGSSQNIFKNIQINSTPQFSAGSNNDNLNFSGINITITSAATNTLVFSAGTGGGGGGGVTEAYVKKMSNRFMGAFAG